MTAWWCSYIVRIGNILAGEDLMGADRALTEVRVFFWCCHFARLEGAAGVRLNDDVSPIVKAIAHELEGLDFARINEVLWHSRMACWEGSYSRRRGGPGVGSDAEGASSSTPPH